MATLPLLTPTLFPVSIRRCSSLCNPCSRPKVIFNPLSVPLRSKSAAVVLSSKSDDIALENASVWDTKPAWCQPWTIILTGVLIIAGSWSVLHSVVVSLIALALIGTWWYVFLYAYPKAFEEDMAEQRKT